MQAISVYLSNFPFSVKNKCHSIWCVKNKCYLCNVLMN
nr:MAG TPA: cytochrome oxidase subunit [Caudoviricetes sp.]DAT21360.1 MAG TPA: cytochrome oxidase subunit [Caudoviricetes sp.]